MNLFRHIVKKLMPPACVHSIKQWRLRRLIRNFSARTVTHRYGALELSIRLTDTLAECWYDHDWPELREIVFMRQGRLRHGALVFDLGAHQGIVAMMLAGEVAPDGQVVAVEATAHNARVARQNAALNLLTDQITVIHALVAR